MLRRRLSLLAWESVDPHSVARLTNDNSRCVAISRVGDVKAALLSGCYQLSLGCSFGGGVLVLIVRQSGGYTCAVPLTPLNLRLKSPRRRKLGGSYAKGAVAFASLLGSAHCLGRFPGGTAIAFALREGGERRSSSKTAARTEARRKVSNFTACGWAAILNNFSRRLLDLKFEVPINCWSLVAERSRGISLLVFWFRKSATAAFRFPGAGDGASPSGRRPARTPKRLLGEKSRGRSPNTPLAGCIDETLLLTSCCVKYPTRASSSSEQNMKAMQQSIHTSMAFTSDVFGRSVSTEPN
uniref:Uncharacterized protein n=1 Tax=Trichuris muris TaxID=70415 RepID=A0A5S6Q713_TRIMR